MLPDSSLRLLTFVKGEKLSLILAQEHPEMSLGLSSLSLGETVGAYYSGSLPSVKMYMNLCVNMAVVQTV